MLSVQETSSQRISLGGSRWRSSREQRASNSFVRWTWLELRLPTWKNVLEGVVAKIGTTFIHAVAKEKIRFEISVFQSFFQVISFVDVDGDKVAVDFLGPTIFRGVITDIGEVSEHPRNREIAGQKNDS